MIVCGATVSEVGTVVAGTATVSPAAAGPGIWSTPACRSVPSVPASASFLRPRMTEPPRVDW
jgi:hypothetical protein